MSKIIPGTEITCPECRKPMLVCKKTPVQNEKISSSWFASLHFNIIKGGHLACPYDGTFFFNEKAGIHTEEHGFTW